MKPEIRDAWTTALESGKYEQGRNRLATVNPNQSVSYCCLGVLCELLVERNALVRVSTDRTRYYYADPNNDDDINASTLPHVAVALSGLVGDAGTIPGLTDRAGDPIALTELNDGGRLTFDQISQVVKYFV